MANKNGNVAVLEVAKSLQPPSTKNDPTLAEIVKADEAGDEALRALLIKADEADKADQISAGDVDSDEVEDESADESEETESTEPEPIAPTFDPESFVDALKLLNDGVKVVAELYLRVYGDKGLRKKNLEIGKAAYLELVKLAKHTPTGELTDGDFDQFVADVSRYVTLKSGMENPARVDDMVRFYLFQTECIRLGLSKVEKIGYGCIVNILATGKACVVFSKAKLTMTVKERWLPRLASWLEDLTRDDHPLSPGEGLKTAVRSFQKQLEDERQGKKTAEQVLAAEQKKAATARNRYSAKVQSDVMNSVEEVLREQFLDPEELMKVVTKAAKAVGKPLPEPKTEKIEVGPNPATMTADDAEMFVRAMFAAKNTVAMLALHKMLGRIIKVLAPETEGELVGAGK